MADKPASGIPQDNDATASKETPPETVVSTPEEVTPAEVTPSKSEESASKPNEAPPDINASKIEEATPPPPLKPFEVSKEPCNRVTAPPPMKSCSCTPKPSLREAFQAALHKLCPKSRSTSKTAVVTLDQRKHMDKDSGTQTPPVEVCLKSKDYLKFDGCQKRSGDNVAKIDPDPAEKLITKVNTNNNNAKENVPEKPKDVPKDVTPKDATRKDANPKEKEVEKNTELELPPCPYPCTPVDTYKKYDDTAPKANETVVQEPGANEPKPQEPAAKEPELVELFEPTEEDQTDQGQAEEPKAPAPPRETVDKKPSKSHCKETPPQTEFCGYRKDKEEGK